MKNIFILLTGQVKIQKIFNNILKNLYKIKSNNNFIIREIIIVTWNNQKKKIGNLKNITILSYPEIIDKGDGNILAQMYHYKKGLDYIKSKNIKNTFILKSRCDVILDTLFLEKIFNYNYNLNNKLLTHKIWIPWAHAIKPFYLGDSCFFSSLSVMSKLYNINSIYERKNLHMGLTHIRRFINPFLNTYPILQKYIKNYNNLSKGMQTIILNLNNKYMKELIKTYYIILDKYFYINTEKSTDIIFRKWTDKSLEINYNLNLQQVSKINHSLKLIYLNDYIKKILLKL